MIRMRHPPLQWRAGGVGGGAHNVAGPSMEGRTIVRPDLWYGDYQRHYLRPPSMEGRTIVRPDVVKKAVWYMRSWTFNGGPDNCPARPCGCLNTRLREPESFNGGPDNCPARPVSDRAPLQARTLLQWRAGQLSGQTWPLVRPVSTSCAPFNGGPDNCPARPCSAASLGWC